MTVNYDLFSVVHLRYFVVVMYTDIRLLTQLQHSMNLLSKEAREHRKVVASN